MYRDVPVEVELVVVKEVQVPVEVVVEKIVERFVEVKEDKVVQVKGCSSAHKLTEKLTFYSRHGNMQLMYFRWSITMCLLVF